MRAFRCFLIVCSTSICCFAPARGDVMTYVDSLATFLSATTEVARESAGDFGADPTTADNIASITRSGIGSLGGAFSYTVQNRDTLAVTTNSALIAAAAGSIAALYLDTDATLDVENPLTQGVSLGEWGTDSSGTGNNTSVGGIASRNAAVITLGTAVTALNFDLVDFEASTGQEALLVLGLGGSIIHSESFAFADTGNDTVHNFGITSTPSMAFDTAVFVLGDDNDTDLSNGYGGAEFWGIGNAIVGTASVAAVPEPSSFVLLTAVAGAVCFRRRRCLN